jgi:cytochrome c peroxidase
MQILACYSEAVSGVYFSMVKVFQLVSLLIAMFFPLISAAESTQNRSFGPKILQLNNQQQAIPPLIKANHPPAVVELGKKLFYDKLLSQNKQQSCSGCHRPDHGFADDRDFSPNTQGGVIPVNTPGLAYSTLLQYQNWAGQLPSLEAQLDVVVENPNVMNLPWPELIRRLKLHSDYPALFRRAGYSDITKTTITDAIVTYEKSLAVPSRFDAFLHGDSNQLSSQEQQGFRKFKNFGCISCHQGTALGGNLRQKFDHSQDCFTNDYHWRKRDLGYFNFTNHPGDKYYFRVPTLRNVALTAPYFHDASAKTLEQAIQVMFRHQLAIEAKPEDISDIAAFLGSLTGIQYESE